MEVNGDAFQLDTVIKSRIFYYKSRENTYQSDTTNHMHMSEHAMKLKVRLIKSLSPEYQAIPKKKYHLFVAVGIVSRSVHS